MQKVLIAGGAGFIGSHLCRDLLQKGYAVVSVDNLITGDKKNIINLLKNPEFTFLQEDIISPNIRSLQHLDFQFIFHLASPASPNKKSPRSYFNKPLETMLANSLGTYHLLELAKKNNAAFLYASTSEVYGDPTVSPQSETYFGNVNPHGVRSVYDEAKRFGEAMTMNYVRTQNVNARIIRIFNTFGPNMQKDDGRVVSNFITQALTGDPITMYGNGKQTRSFCYVDDMIVGIEKAMFETNTNGEVINLGNPDERSIEELSAIIKKMTNSPSKIVIEQLPEDDPKQRVPDIQKASRLLNWEPRVSLEEGLQKTIEYFKTVVL